MLERRHHIYPMCHQLSYYNLLTKDKLTKLEYKLKINNDTVIVKHTKNVPTEIHGFFVYVR